MCCVLLLNNWLSSAVFLGLLAIASHYMFHVLFPPYLLVHLCEFLVLLDTTRSENAQEVALGTSVGVGSIAVLGGSSRGPSSHGCRRYEHK